MWRTAYFYAVLAATAAALTFAGVVRAQSNSSNPYEGVSTPPPDSTITTPAPQPAPKPAPGKPMTAASAPTATAVPQVPDIVTGQGASSASAAASASAAEGTDSGIARVEPATNSEPVLNQRPASANPDGDIVHPAPLPPGMLDVGTLIRARLLGRLSTAYSQPGDAFRAQVASDVFRGNQILIPAGSEIDGVVAHVSTGHFAGHGSMLLRPETVILPDGSRFHLYAQVTAAPGTNTRINDEGSIAPGSHMKKDAAEYGGGAGAGAVSGAVLAGPAGALAGTVVGAGAVTVHLLLDHPQATLQAGTVLDFSLTEPLSLVAASAPANEAPANE